MAFTFPVSDDTKKDIAEDDCPQNACPPKLNLATPLAVEDGVTYYTFVYFFCAVEKTRTDVLKKVFFVDFENKRLLHALKCYF